MFSEEIESLDTRLLLLETILKTMKLSTKMSVPLDTLLLLKVYMCGLHFFSLPVQFFTTILEKYDYSVSDYKTQNLLNKMIKLVELLEEVVYIILLFKIE